MNPQALNLNQILRQNNPLLEEVLSEKGKGFFFPYQGILGQSAQAASKKYNATIGIAKEEDGSPMRLGVLNDLVNLKAGETFPYAPSFGLPNLRSRWKEMLVEKNPSLAGKAVSVPVVTQALTHGLALAGYLFLNEGEELLVPTPYWDNYDLLFGQSIGAKVNHFECFTSEGHFNVAGLQKELNARAGKKIVLLLNFPNNPTGYTPLQKDMDAIVKTLVASADAGSKLVVLIDDAYFGLVYEDGVAKESIFAPLADAHKNILAVKIDGATKEDYVWGFRVGFLTYGIKGASEEAYKALADKTGGVVRSVISNCSMLSQSLLLKAFTHPDYEKQKQEKFELLQARYKMIIELLKTHKEYADVFQPLPFNSGYFMCLKPVAGIDAEKVRLLLLEKYDTGIINLQGLIRVAFSCTPKDTIATTFQNIYNACLEVKQGV